MWDGQLSTSMSQHCMSGAVMHGCEIYMDFSNVMWVIFR